MTSSRMASGPVRSMKKKSRRSPGPATVGGGVPALTACAARTMSERAAWRKISVRRTTGTTPDSIRSSSTRPGPTGASWSTSPTSRTCVRGPTAPSSGSARRGDSHRAWQRAGAAHRQHRPRVDDEEVGAGDRVARAAGEALAGDVLEQPVDRARLGAGQLAQPPRGLAGRGAEPDAALLVAHQVDERAHRLRLAGAGQA